MLDNINGFYFINNRFNINILHEDKCYDLSIDQVAEFVIGAYNGETFLWGKIWLGIDTIYNYSLIAIDYF